MSAPALALIPPERVRTVWPAIRPRIEAVRATCDEPWLTEDVFGALVDRRAFLWGPGDLGDGFIIVQLEDLAWHRRLFVWITVSGGDFTTRDYWPQVLKIAADHGCRRIRFESPREGWARALPAAELRFIYEFQV